MKSDFAVALHIMGFLAARAGKPLSSTTLAESYGTNPVVIRRLLSKLQAADLVVSQRGVGGGTVLAADPRKISLRQVYEAVNEAGRLLPRHRESEGALAGVLADYIDSLCTTAEAALLNELGRTSVAQMDAKVRPAICARLEKMTDEDEVGT